MKTAFLTYLHAQPKAAPFSYFDIGQKAYYAAEEKNRGLKALLKAKIEPLLIFLEADSARKINISVTIPVLEYLQQETSYGKRVRQLIKAGQIELLAGQGYNSLSILFSRALFMQELDYQVNLLSDFTAGATKGFVNTAMLYSDAYGEIIEAQGFAYAAVPRISWFISDSENSLFKARSGDLRLYSVEAETSQTNLLPVSVLLIEDINDTQNDFNEGSVLFSEIEEPENLPQYSLPEIVAFDTLAGGIESIVGNNLQKDFLSRLIALSPNVASANNRAFSADFLWLASLAHFTALSAESEERYKVYSKLLTMLYDLEIKLR